jgi:hypothetical protein
MIELRDAWFAFPDHYRYAPFNGLHYLNGLNDLNVTSHRGGSFFGPAMILNSSMASGSRGTSLIAFS